MAASVSATCSCLYFLIENAWPAGSSCLRSMPALQSTSYNDSTSRIRDAVPIEVIGLWTDVWRLAGAYCCALVVDAQIKGMEKRAG